MIWITRHFLNCARINEGERTGTDSAHFLFHVALVCRCVDACSDLSFLQKWQTRKYTRYNKSMNITVFQQR